MKMTRAYELENILNDQRVSVTESTLSYFEYLVPKSELNKAVLLHRKRPSEAHRRKTTVAEDLNLSAELDLTGTPLEYALCYSQLDETIADNRNWKKDEESYSPLAKSEARLAINRCREILSKQNLSAPLFAVCDGKDNDETVLIGSNVDEQWFTTVQVVVSDAPLLSKVEETPATLLEEYINLYCVQKEKVNTAVCCSYVLCGKRPGVLDLSEITTPGSIDCNLSIEINWNTLSFYAPIRNSSATLVMEIMAGWGGSNLENLWNELASINRYLDTLEQCKTNVQTPPTLTPSNSVDWDEVELKLNSLLNGEIENEFPKDENEDDDGDVARGEKIKTLVDKVQSRRNINFCDMLWEVLKGCTDYTQLTTSFRMVLHQIQTGSAAPQFNTTSSTRIGDIISAILNEEKAVPLLDQNSPLELLIDTGLEKLSRDYTYILLSANLIDLYDIQQTLRNVRDGVFDVESYRKKLTSLAQMHLCLEFTLLAENYLNFPSTNLRSIFSHAFRKYTSDNSATELYSDRLGSEMQSLSVPLSTNAVANVAKGLPSSWCLRLSSKSRDSTITTTTYLSRTPIVPPNIYCFDEVKEHEIYHCLKSNVSSIKFA